MRTYKNQKITQQVVESVTCDCCNTTYKYDDTNIFETQEFLTYENDAGYGSVMGDGNQIRGDFCQHCVQKLLGPYLRVVGSYIYGEVYDPPRRLDEIK